MDNEQVLNEERQKTGLTEEEVAEELSRMSDSVTMINNVLNEVFFTDHKVSTIRANKNYIEGKLAEDYIVNSGADLSVFDKPLADATQFLEQNPNDEL